MKTKLIILSTFYDPYMSGAEQMVKVILERLGPQYDTVLLTGRFDNKLPFYEERKGFKMYRLGIGHKQIDKFLYIILAAFKIRTLKPDIVHAVMESYAGGVLVLIKLLYSRALRILTLQSGDLDDDIKQKKLAVRIFWKAIHRAPHHVTAISTFLAKRAERLGVEKENISLTPNGVYLSDIPQNIEKIPNRVVFVGRISWEKGVNYIVSAWPEVLKKIPSARLILVGPDDNREDGARKKIDKIIKDTGTAESIEFLGWQPHDKTLIEIVKAEVFVCPSLAEGLGLVNVEAQACGTPPISSRVGGIPDVIQTGENGLLVEPKNPEQIAEAIIKLLTDNNLYHKLQANGLKSAQKFDWPGIIEKVDGLYQKLLENKKSGV